MPILQKSSELQYVYMKNICAFSVNLVDMFINLKFLFIAVISRKKYWTKYLEKVKSSASLCGI